jgi:hypothetical protein
MVRIGNAPDTTSLEQKVFRLLERHPSGLSRKGIDKRFKHTPARDLDAALRCLQSCKLAVCTNDVWWAK